MRTWFVKGRDELGQPFAEIVYAEDRADANKEFELFGYPVVVIEIIEPA